MPGAPKIYLLDTSVLLHRPEALFSFGDNEVIIPLVVLDELDRFKRGSMQIHRNARVTIKHIDQLRANGPLDQGVDLDGGGRLKIHIDDQDALRHLPPGFEINNDNRILATALAVHRGAEGRRVVLVSKDINMRVKAQALGLAAEDYRADQIVDIGEMYTGHLVRTVPHERLEEIYRERNLPVEVLELGFELYPHQFVMLSSATSSFTTALTRYRANDKALHLLREIRHDVWGIRPLNREQRYALEVLLDDEVQLVTLAGKAGTGKTLLAIAAGLQKVVNEKQYRRLAIYRPVIPMGRDIGFLPGTEQEKLSPWMQPVFDNLEFLLLEQAAGRGKSGPGGIDYLIDSNQLEIRALTYIRGRSLPQQFIVIDEAQNLTPHEVKTIITRAGEGTKIILTGDPYQIDHPYLDSTSNGLTHVVERFRVHTLAAHVTLLKGERSPLAELASVVMEE